DALTLRRASLRDHAPALGDRVDLAGSRACGPQWSAVVEPGSPIPLAVPGVTLDGPGVVVDMCQQLAGRLVIAAATGVLGEAPAGGDQEPRQPHALTATLDADSRETVVPVATTNEWQAVRTASAGTTKCADAVLVQARSLIRFHWLLIELVLVR